jgi:hypothetical protein
MSFKLSFIVAIKIIKIVQDEPNLLPYSYGYDIKIIEDYCNSMKTPYLDLDAILDFSINFLERLKIISNWPGGFKEYKRDSLNLDITNFIDSMERYMESFHCHHD